MECMACLYFFGLATSVCRYNYDNSELNFRYLLASWPRNLAGSFKLLIFAGMIYGEKDDTGGITRTGDEMVRTALYEAANVLLSRITRFSKLKRWGIDV